jgi:dipeptidyl aminopeptidase/acylaminoacyl peptidase
MKPKTKKLLAIILLVAISISLIMTYLSLPPQPLEDLTQHYNVTRLTTSPADDRNLVWSPDGNKIFFKSDSYICVMDSDGSNVTKLAEGGHAALSPDGNKIFYIQRKGRELLYQAWVMNADGSNRKKIAELAFTYLSEDLGVEPLFLYSWSPDRTKIVVYESEYTGYGLRIENGSYVRSEQKVKPSKEWPLLESIWTYGIWDLEKNTTRELTSFGPFEHGWPCLGEVVWSPYRAYLGHRCGKWRKTEVDLIHRR